MPYFVIALPYLAAILYSMIKAIDAVNNFNSENKVMILGDMNELGQFSEEEHIKIGKVTKKLKIKVKIL